MGPESDFIMASRLRRRTGTKIASCERPASRRGVGCLAGGAETDLRRKPRNNPVSPSLTPQPAARFYAANKRNGMATAPLASVGQSNG